MPQVVIENPMLNSLFAEPNRCGRFSDDEIVNGHRPSAYFMAIPKVNPVQE